MSVRLLTLGCLFSFFLGSVDEASAQYFRPRFFGPPVVVPPVVVAPRVVVPSRVTRYPGGVVVPVAPVPASPPAYVDISPLGVSIDVPGFSFRSGSYGAARIAVADPSVTVMPPYPAPPVTSGADAVDLEQAAARLAAALRLRQDGDIWLDYLKSESVAALGRGEGGIDAKELLGRYQGVTANASLTWLQGVDGFGECLAGLTALASGASPVNTVPNAQPTPAPNVEDAPGASPEATMPSSGESLLMPTPDPQTDAASVPQAAQPNPTTKI